MGVNPELRYVLGGVGTAEYGEDGSAILLLIACKCVLRGGNLSRYGCRAEEGVCTPEVR